MYFDFFIFVFMKENPLYTVAFYNLENLFDTTDDPTILDDDFTTNGRLKWSEKRYENKLFKLRKAISNIGKDETQKTPSLIGVAEVENKKVLDDLLKNHIEYDFVHYNSPDERGIDTALIFKKKHFKIIHSEPLPVLIYEEVGNRDYTRDILYVHGLLHNNPVHIYVNHWPSRRGNGKDTSHKRIAAAKIMKSHLEMVQNATSNATCIIMGDFNDNPHCVSIKNHLMTDNLYNPMTNLLNPTEVGSLSYKSEWNLFDQIIVSTNFLDPSNCLHFLKAGILNDRFLQEWDNSFKGIPFRTYAGKKYLGGYSDHFPVYTIFRKQC